VSGNDDGLATVLGHEVAHQGTSPIHQQAQLISVLRHGAERMSSMKVLFALGLVLETLGLDVGFSRLLLTFLLQ
jgi:Zn-dependent protease with chaperone function